MRFSRKFAVLLFSCLLIPAIAAAETVYVSDQLVITLRRGNSTEYKILKTLETGTPMEVIERTEGDNFVKVRLRSGEEGYVLGQYLTGETPKAITISRLENQLEKVRDQLARAKAELSQSSQEEGALTGSINELNQALANTKEELRATTEKYNTLLKDSAAVVEITNERDLLNETNEKLATEVRSLTAENSDLMRTGAVRWFLAGAGVLFLGWIIGKASRKKRSRL
ncbi:MAG: TIGR04211 family SH3 domain-containing protein [Desulfobulbaceae bacterium]|nr:TIGR04211 family SH3 domain-containing protein [Desulfobulbaceae bacterium]